MISRQKFLDNVEKLWQDNPVYRTGGTGADGTCDCIGMIMGAMYAAGHKKYDLHSSNYFARYQMENFYPISSEAHVYRGMVVYKAREDISQLNERYQPGGRYYTGDMLDYYHVGVVVDIDPLQIMHCTSGNGANGIIIDDSMGKWNYGGMLKDVQYEDAVVSDEEDEVTAMYKAVVIAESGSTVNMRTGPNESYPRMAKVPVGATVEVQTEAGDWARIAYSYQIGYMMRKFLLKEETEEKTVTVTLPRYVAEALMKAFGEVL